jgi:serine/threonine protein kinase
MEKLRPFAHPNIMPVYSRFVDTLEPLDLPDWDVSTEDLNSKTTFMVLPLLRLSLLDLIRQREQAALGQQGQRQRLLFARAEIVSVLRGLASALVFLHCRRVSHRDIKPGNMNYLAQIPFFTYLLLSDGVIIFSQHIYTHAFIYIYIYIYIYI